MYSRQSCKKYAPKHQARFEILKFQNQNFTLSRSFVRRSYYLAITRPFKIFYGAFRARPIR